MTIDVTDEIAQAILCAAASLIIVGWLAMIALSILPV